MVHSRGDRDLGVAFQTHPGSQASSPGKQRTPLSSRVAAGFSSYDGDLRLPLWLALGSAIFLSSCEGKLGVALESLQGRRDLT